jgi:uncharacterized protein Smg (DUF494 family)
MRPEGQPRPEEKAEGAKSARTDAAQKSLDSLLEETGLSDEYTPPAGSLLEKIAAAKAAKKTCVSTASAPASAPAPSVVWDAPLVVGLLQSAPDGGAAAGIPRQVFHPDSGTYRLESEAPLREQLAKEAATSNEQPDQWRGFWDPAQLLREAQIKAAMEDPNFTIAQMKAVLKAAMHQRALWELAEIGINLRDYYAPQKDRVVVQCVGHKVKRFVANFATLMESGREAVIDAPAMERVAQELANQDAKFKPLVYPFHRSTDMQGEAALAYLVCRCPRRPPPCHRSRSLSWDAGGLSRVP